MRQIDNRGRIFSLLSLEEEDGAVAQVEVDEVLSLCCLVPISAFCPLFCNTTDRVRGWKGGIPHTMSHEASKVPADDAVPCRTFSLVERSLDVLSNVLQTRSVHVLYLRGRRTARLGFFEGWRCRTFSIVYLAIAS